MNHYKQLRKGVKVIVISGAQRGLVGNIDYISKRGVFLKKGATCKRHFKNPIQTQEKGMIIEKIIPIHPSNVAIWDEEKAKK